VVVLSRCGIQYFVAEPGLEDRLNLVQVVFVFGIQAEYFCDDVAI